MCNLAQLSWQKAKKQLSLFVSMGKWLWHLPQPRFLPRLGLWGCIQVFGCIRVPTSLGKTSARLLWLGTGSIQIGRSNPASMRERSPHCLTVHEEHNLAWCWRSTVVLLPCWGLTRRGHCRQNYQMAHPHMCSISACDAQLLRGVFFAEQIGDVWRHFKVSSDRTFLPWVTWFDWQVSQKSKSWQFACLSASHHASLRGPPQQGCRWSLRLTPQHVRLC